MYKSEKQGIRNAHLLYNTVLPGLDLGLLHAEHAYKIGESKG